MLYGRMTCLAWMVEPLSPLLHKVSLLTLSIYLHLSVEASPVPTEPPAHRSSATVLTELLGGRSASLPTLLTLVTLVGGLSLALPKSSSVLVLLPRLVLSFRSLAPPLALRTLAIGLNCAPGGIPIPIPVPPAPPPPLRTGDAGYAGVGVKCTKSAMLNFAVPGVAGGNSDARAATPPGVPKNGSPRTGGGSRVGSPGIEPRRKGDAGDGRSIDTEADARVPPPLPLDLDDVIGSWNSTRAVTSPPGLRACEARAGLGELASSKSMSAASSLPPPAPGGFDDGC